MSSTPITIPFLDLQPPPLEVMAPQDIANKADDGSIGPVIGVLSVIIIVGVFAGMVGRLCSGRPIMGYGGQYDFESWVEKKFSSCLDGRVGPPRPDAPPASSPDPAADDIESNPEGVNRSNGGGPSPGGAEASTNGGGA